MELSFSLSAQKGAGHLPGPSAQGSGSRFPLSLLLLPQENSPLVLLSTETAAVALAAHGLLRAGPEAWRDEQEGGEREGVAPVLGADCARGRWLRGQSILPSPFPGRSQYHPHFADE